MRKIDFTQIITILANVGVVIGLVFLTLDSPHAVPLYNVYSQIVYALEASDVNTVFVGGRPLLLNRRLTTLDEPAILARARAYGKRVVESLKGSSAPKN